MNNSNQIEEVVNQISEGYQTLVESAPFGIIIGDAEGEIYHVNSHFTELTGYTRADVPDRATWFKKAYPDPEYRAEVKKSWKKYMRSPEAKVDEEFRVTCRDGSQKTVSFKANELENNNILLTLEDVTEKRKTERALETSKNKLDSIVQAVGVPLFMLEQNHEIIWTNEESQKVFDRQLVGKKCHRVFLDQEESCDDCSAERAFDDEKKHSHEIKIESGKGEARFFHCTFNVAQYKPDGQPLTVLGILQDQTENVERERTLKLFRTLMDETQEGVFIVRPHTGEILDVNKAVCRRLGYTKSELLDMYVWDISGHFEDEKDYLEQKDLITEKPGETIETVHKHSDGSNCPVEVTISDVEVNTNQYRVTVSRDVSRNKKMQKKLRQKSEEMEQFAYAASHDLRKPINKLFAFCDFLEMGIEKDEQETVRQNLDRLRSTAADMEELIEELLDLSRAGTQDLTEEEVELEDCIQKSLELFEADIGQENARVEVDLSSSIQADPTLLKQVFKNLIGNALKYNDSTPVIRITDKKLEKQVQVRVEDNGPGIPEDKTEEIFIPMYRGPDTETEGTGLGLAICRKIVERHDGRIEAENTEAGGARFELTLPKPE